MAITKYQVGRHWEVDLEEARRETAALVDQLHHTPDFSEGVQSFIEKRAARFQPLSVEPRLPPPIP